MPFLDAPLVWSLMSNYWEMFHRINSFHIKGCTPIFLMTVSCFNCSGIIILLYYAFDLFAVITFQYLNAINMELWLSCRFSCRHVPPHKDKCWENLRCSPRHVPGWRYKTTICFQFYPPWFYVAAPPQCSKSPATIL